MKKAKKIFRKDNFKLRLAVILPLLFVILISGYGIAVFYNLSHFFNSPKAIFNPRIYLIITIISSFCIGLALTYAILMPIRRLRQMLKDIERNNFSLTKHPNVEQEIEEVFQSFEHLHSSLEIRRRREVLQRLASLGQLAAGVAHEIRNPLGSIKGLMNLIAESLPDGDPRNEYAEVILREVGRMEGIINRFLSVSPSKYMEINQEEINLDLILDEAISLAKLSCSQTNEIEIIKEGNLDVNIIGDREKLGQALFNVILNAHQAMPKEGGTLRVSIKRLEDNSIQVKFSDTGMGIAEENIERIFDPFYTSKEEGVGLGLTITHQIITAHKGDIRVESIKGKGSDFIISLPVGG